MRIKLHLSKDELDALDDVLDTIIPLLGKSRAIDYFFRGIRVKDILTARIKLFELRENLFGKEHQEVNQIIGKALSRGIRKED